MDTNKARGPDDLPVEVIKLLKDTGTKWIKSCFSKIMSEGIPQDWRKSNTTPIYKQKRDPLDCGNYWGTKLVNHLLKFCERVTEAWLRKILKIKATSMSSRRANLQQNPGNNPEKNTVQEWDAVFYIWQKVPFLPKAVLF